MIFSKNPTPVMSQISLFSGSSQSLVPVAGTAGALGQYTPAYRSAPAAQAPPMPENTVTVISVTDIVRYLRKRWKLGVMIGLPLAAITFSALGLGEKIYESESRLLLRIQDTNVFNFSEMSHAAISEVSAPMLVNNHRSELQARRYLEYLYTQIPEAERLTFIDPELHPKASWKDYLRFLSTPKPAADPRELFINKLALNTRVEPLKDSHVIRVQIRDHSPAMAAKLANYYVQDYISYVSEQELKVTKATSEFLEQKSGELRARLQQSEDTLSSYRKTESLVQDSELKDYSGEKVRLLTQALSDLEVKHSKSRQDLDTIRAAQQSGRDLLQVRLLGDNPDVSTNRKLLEAAQAELANLLVLRGRKHPVVLEKIQKIESIKASIKDNIQAVVAMTEQEEANTQRQTEDLKLQLEKSRNEVLAMGGKNIQQNLLRDQVAMDRELYQNILKRMNQNDLTGQFKDSGSLRVSDIATEPDAPVKPSKAIALLASMLIFGFCFTGVPIGWGFAEDYLKPAMLMPLESKTAPAKESSTALTVPSLNSDTTKTPVLARLPDVPTKTHVDLLAQFLGNGTGGAIVELQQMVASLEARASQHSGPRVALILSAESGEGKSLTASALAGALCMKGHSTLLMDCNPDAPSLHRWYPQARSHSASANDLDSLRYGTTNLFILPALDLPSHDLTELVSGYSSWIDKAQHQVDWVVIDGPSVLRGYADTIQLLNMATDIIFVHDASRISSAKAQGALQLLKPKLRQEICGVVLNRQSA